MKLKKLSSDGSFEGYGSVFNVVDAYRDVILPGAFANTLKAHKDAGTMPALLWQHKSAEPIGVYTDMREDKHGLFVKGQLLTEQSVPRADEAYALLKAGAVNGLSIGFNVPAGGEEFEEESNTFQLSEIDLWETSIVTFPANREAIVTEVRSLLDAIERPKEFEAFLRDAGLSIGQAKRLMAGGYAAMRQRDVDDPDSDPRDVDPVAVTKACEATQAIIRNLRGED